MKPSSTSAYNVGVFFTISEKTVEFLKFQRIETSMSYEYYNTFTNYGDFRFSFPRPDFKWKSFNDVVESDILRPFHIELLVATLEIHTHVLK